MWDVKRLESEPYKKCYNPHERFANPSLPSPQPINMWSKHHQIKYWNDLFSHQWKTLDKVINSQQQLLQNIVKNLNTISREYWSLTITTYPFEMLIILNEERFLKVTEMQSVVKQGIAKDDDQPSFPTSGGQLAYRKYRTSLRMLLSVFVLQSLLAFPLLHLWAVELIRRCLRIE